MPMDWRIASTMLLLAIAGTPASAKLCGDDVQGQRVPCACGDVVVADVVLGDDPVVREACPGDGLLVQAEPHGAALTIDLHGKTLRGTGHGAGIWVLRGGAGGTRIVSSGGRASIEGFRDGVLAHGADSLGLLSTIAVVRSGRDGVNVDAPGYEIRDVEARESGRDGFALGGTWFGIHATRAVNSRRFGYSVAAWNAWLGAPGAGVVAEGSGMAAISINGMGLALVDCVAADGARDGIRLAGMHHDVHGCVARGNAGDGITGSGGDIRLQGNTATNNGQRGIHVGGVDGGGNRASGNGERLGVVMPSECEINGRDCAE